MIFYVAMTMLNKKTEQRVNFKFLAKQKKTATEIFVLLHEAYRENALPRACMFQWCKRFSEGREDVRYDNLAVQ
jgi:hypothetical protein